MQCNLVYLFTLNIKRNKWRDILFPLKLNIRVWTGSKGVPSTTRGFSECRAVQRGFKWLQHRQVREAKAKDGAGCGWHARIWHPRTPQKIQKSLWMKMNRKMPNRVFFFLLLFFFLHQEIIEKGFHGEMYLHHENIQEFKLFASIKYINSFLCCCKVD